MNENILESQHNTNNIKINLSTKISNVKMNNPLMNAAGALCTSEEHLFNLNNSRSGALITKSITWCPRDGNHKPKYYHNDFGSINSNGLENLGIDTYIEIFRNNEPFFKRMSSKPKWNKPFFFSISGMSLEDNMSMLRKINNISWKSIVELNLSCPNVIGKPQVGYSLDDMYDYIENCTEIYSGTLGLKLPPYFDIIHFEQVADLIKKFTPKIKFITCCNSLGNGLMIDTETETTAIHPKEGLGGIGGQYIKPTALANVWKFRNLLPSEIDIIGCGGISTGEDVFQHILCGASVVQIGTQLMKEGVECFERINNELREIMMEKNYSSIKDFQGKLNVKKSD